MKQRKFINFTERITAGMMVAAFVFFVNVSSLLAAVDHTDKIISYEVSKTCSTSKCHPGIAEEMTGTLHYKLMGDVQHVFDMFTNDPVTGPMGKGNRY